MEYIYEVTDKRLNKRPEDIIKDNLVIVGTSHVSKISVAEVKKSFTQFNPDIIAVELDQERFNYLYESKILKKKIKKKFNLSSTSSFLINFIGAFIQKRIGQKLGLIPGSEMLEAIKIAKDNKKNLALIDQSAKMTIQKLSRSLSFFDKLKLFLSAIISLIYIELSFIINPIIYFFYKIFPNKKYLKINMKEIPDDKTIDQILKLMKKKYPKIYRILIEERNHHMAKNLARLAKDNKVLAIVGAGHKKELELLVLKYLKTE